MIREIVNPGIEVRAERCPCGECRDFKVVLDFPGARHGFFLTDEYADALSVRLAGAAKQCRVRRGEEER